jgi:hypothetical protein
MQRGGAAFTLWRMQFPTPTHPALGPRRPFPGRLSPLLLPLLGLALLAGPALAGDAQAPDAVILPGGERMACRILEDEAGWLTVQVGERTYRLERARLEGVERDGEPLLDEDLVEAVVGWGDQLTSPHDGVRQGARAALLSLGPTGGPYLRAAARRVGSGPAAVELRSLATAAEERGRRALLEEAARAVALRPLQEGAFAPAVLRYLEACAAGGDAPEARARLESAVAGVLDGPQRDALSTWLDERPGAGTP